MSDRSCRYFKSYIPDGDNIKISAQIIISIDPTLMIKILSYLIKIKDN